MVALLETPRTRTNQPEPTRRPYLENGDRLTRAEFERRYTSLPALRKAELIEGVVQMPSPIHIEHQIADGAILFWLGIYVSATPCLQFGGDGSVRLDADNEVQPDALLRIEETCGGQSRIGADGFVEGAPELVVEISGSSALVRLARQTERLPARWRAGICCVAGVRRRHQLVYAGRRALCCPGARRTGHLQQPALSGPASACAGHAGWQAGRCAGCRPAGRADAGTRGVRGTTAGAPLIVAQAD